MTQNILLVIIDTARGDIVSDLCKSGDLPHLQSLANTGQRYQNAVTPSPWTLPSHANIFTGRRASDHGSHAGHKYFDPDTPPLAEHLQREGYRTVGLSGNIWVSPQFGFDRGFDHFSMKYDRFWSGSHLSGVSEADSIQGKVKQFANTSSAKTLLPTLLNGIHTKYQLYKQDDGGRNATRRTRRWLQKNGRSDTPFFYFLSYLEPHLEYRPPKRLARRFLPDEIEYADAMAINQDPWEYIAGTVDHSEKELETLRALYKAELVFVDEQLGKLIDGLGAQGLRDETTIIIVGDHGENIGDHGLMDHQYCLYQTLVHVPLIISGPGFENGSVSDLVSTRDLYPTILDIANVDIPDHDGISRKSLVDGSNRDTVISEYLAPQPSIESLRENVGTIQSDRPLDRTYRAIQTANWKLIEASDGEIELFNLDTDPYEQAECSGEYPDRVEELQTELDQKNGSLSVDDTGEIMADKKTRERLADLGYL